MKIYLSMYMTAREPYLASAHSDAAQGKWVAGASRSTVSVSLDRHLDTCGTSAQLFFLCYGDTRTKQWIVFILDGAWIWEKRAMLPFSKEGPPGLVAALLMVAELDSTCSISVAILRRTGAFRLVARIGVVQADADPYTVYAILFFYVDI